MVSPQRGPRSRHCQDLIRPDPVDVKYYYALLALSSQAILKGEFLVLASRKGEPGDGEGGYERGSN